MSLIGPKSYSNLWGGVCPNAGSEREEMTRSAAPLSVCAGGGAKALYTERRRVGWDVIYSRGKGVKKKNQLSLLLVD